jgi:hypothetical protein
MGGDLAYPLYSYVALLQTRRSLFKINNGCKKFVANVR